MKITVIGKKIYGRILWYAADDWTKEFILLFKNKNQGKIAFGHEHLKKLAQLGFEIVVLTEEIKL